MNKELLMQLFQDYMKSYMGCVLKKHRHSSDEIAYEIMETNQDIFFNTLEEEIEKIVDNRISNIMTDEQLNDLYVQSYHKGFGQ